MPGVRYLWLLPFLYVITTVQKLIPLTDTFGQLWCPLSIALTETELSSLQSVPRITRMHHNGSSQDRLEQTGATLRGARVATADVAAASGGGGTRDPPDVGRIVSSHSIMNIVFSCGKK